MGQGDYTKGMWSDIVPKLLMSLVVRAEGADYGIDARNSEADGEDCPHQIHQTRWLIPSDWISQSTMPREMRKLKVKRAIMQMRIRRWKCWTRLEVQLR